MNNYSIDDIFGPLKSEGKRAKRPRKPEASKKEAPRAPVHAARSAPNASSLALDQAMSEMMSEFGGGSSCPASTFVLPPHRQQPRASAMPHAPASSVSSVASCASTRRPKQPGYLAARKPLPVVEDHEGRELLERAKRMCIAARDVAASLSSFPASSSSSLATSSHSPPSRLEQLSSLASLTARGPGTIQLLGGDGGGRSKRTERRAAALDAHQRRAARATDQEAMAAEAGRLQLRRDNAAASKERALEAGAGERRRVREEKQCAAAGRRAVAEGYRFVGKGSASSSASASSLSSLAAGGGPSGFASPFQPHDAPGFEDGLVLRARALAAAASQAADAAAHVASMAERQAERRRRDNTPGEAVGAAATYGEDDPILMRARAMLAETASSSGGTSGQAPAVAHASPSSPSRLAHPGLARLPSSVVASPVRQPRGEPRGEPNSAHVTLQDPVLARAKSLCAAVSVTSFA